MRNGIWNAHIMETECGMRIENGLTEMYLSRCYSEVRFNVEYSKESINLLFLNLIKLFD